MSTKAQEVRRIKQQASDAKRELIYLERELAAISKKEADKLGSIIGKLEQWQCSGL